ncbi:aspartate carbamoyltransferase catalytic subunit [Paracoccus sp. DMF-8]|uniref:aspartate carbamoyltransferase catalytic subunit n=1 Tax=Paracoccus sp. DMF-8 TaxID=3019445 RepID=UPI0023E3DB5C|nr:aspartate carbamoyltransferase catalytic subunit [Paracoccus sp. DMF-8]MDF3607996.1 aspartate carbamoyltransferase catalytic subunit [Paracoccus sp. DMF-8]
MNPAQSLSGMLHKGERIVWQGRPSVRVHLRPYDLLMILFGLFFAGFALFWIIVARAQGGSFWQFGLIHFIVGIALIATPLIWQPFVRARSSYVLTDRRAFIVSELPLFGRKTDIYPLRNMTELSLKDGTPGTIWFASRHSWSNTRPIRRIGFEFIPDAARVFGLINRAQEEHP